MIRVAVAVIWQCAKRDALLISKRPEGKHLSGFWEFPGGKIDDHEDTLAALRRELLEELNIGFDQATPLLEVRYQYPDRRVLLDVWEVIGIQGQPEGCEGQLFNWVSPAELANYRFPAANQPVLNAIRKSTMRSGLVEKSHLP